MRVCGKHWQALKDAIDERGLSHLISKDGKEAADRMLAEAQGEDVRIDPLLAVNNMVMGRALEGGGLGMLGVDEKGEPLCPVCEAMRGYAYRTPQEETEQEWINGPCDAILKECREKGLVA